MPSSTVRLKKDGKLKAGVALFALQESNYLFLYTDKTRQKLLCVFPIAISYFLYPLPSDKKEVQFRVISPMGDVVNFVAQTQQKARYWVNLVRTVAKQVKPQLMKTLRMPCPFRKFSGEIIKMGWVRQQIGEKWHWRYAVLTDFNFTVFQRAAATPEDLTCVPELVFALYEFRLVKVSTRRSPEHGQKFMAGLHSNLMPIFFAFETAVEQVNWLNAITSTTLKSIVKQEIFRFPATTSEHVRGKLIIRYSFGVFFVLDDKEKTVLWKHPLREMKIARPVRQAIEFDFGRYEPNGPVKIKLGSMTLGVSNLIQHMMAILRVLKQRRVSKDGAQGAALPSPISTTRSGSTTLSSAAQTQTPRTPAMSRMKGPSSSLAASAMKQSSVQPVG